MAMLMSRVDRKLIAISLQELQRDPDAPAEQEPIDDRRMLPRRDPHRPSIAP